MVSSVKNVDNYINNHPEFKEVLIRLRAILLTKPLEETIKWGMPTYVFEKKNLFGIGAFKNHASLWFFQGTLLKDKYQLLHNAQEGKTKAMRQIHYNSIDEIDTDILGNYIQESMGNQINGLVIKPIIKSGKIVVPSELLLILNGRPELMKSFNGFTSGKQREFVEHITTAKKAATKLSRIEKIIPLILDNKGLYDKYKIANTTR